MNTLLTISLLIIAAIVVYGIMASRKSEATINQEERDKKLSELRDEYDRALKSGDKADALQKGRMYYSFLRQGGLTIYDEQALANDLSTMK